jgi:hypothetical protein
LQFNLSSMGLWSAVYTCSAKTSALSGTSHFPRRVGMLMCKLWVSVLLFDSKLVSDFSVPWLRPHSFQWSDRPISDVSAGNNTMESSDEAESEDWVVCIAEPESFVSSLARNFGRHAEN